MRERLGVQIDLHDAGLDLGELNVIASPLQTMRDVFDLMPTDDGGTDLVLEHSRLDGLRAANPTVADGVADGWASALARLSTSVEGVRR